jgi:hypothetical protein
MRPHHAGCPLEHVLEVTLDVILKRQRIYGDSTVFKAAHVPAMLHILPQLKPHYYNSHLVLA